MGQAASDDHLDDDRTTSAPVEPHATEYPEELAQDSLTWGLTGTQLYSPGARIFCREPAVEHSAATLPIVEGPAMLDAFAPGQRVRIVGVLGYAPWLEGLEASVAQFDEAEGLWRVVLDSKRCVSMSAQNLDPIVEQSSGRHSRLHDGVEDMLEPGAVVRVSGLKSSPELNGSLGTVVRWCVGDRRWKVRMTDVSAKLFKEENLDFVSAPPERGACARWAASKSRLAPPAPRPQLGSPRTAQMMGCTGSSSLEQERRFVMLPERGSPRLSPCHEAGAVSSAQLVQVGSAVRVTGLNHHASLNGRCGFVVRWEEEECMWKVRMADGSWKLFKERNLEVLGDTGGQSSASNNIDEWSSYRYSDCSSAQGTPAGTRSFDGLCDVGRPRTDSSVSFAVTEATGTEELFVGCRVRLKGLRTHVELNGFEGHLAHYDERKLRWRVQLDLGIRTWARATNVEVLRAAEPISPEEVQEAEAGAQLFAAGHRVRIHGLNVCTDLNGQEGTIVRWDDAERRWKVLLVRGQSCKLFREANLQPA